MIQMKRWGLLILTLIILGTILAGVRSLYENRARKKRELLYQAALTSYSAALKPGMTRKDVEDYLRAKQIGFGQSCCVDFKAFSNPAHDDWVYDDLVRVGHEDAPWYCSEHNVYVAFQFNSYGKHGTTADANSTDMLKAISLFHALERCL
jgi:hypothetical protein